MLTTSARLLRLLSALQAPGNHSGPELAQRLEVSPRTVRSDIAALRDLGYAVESNPGITGGYTLGAGSDLPPLLLDDEEAVAMAVGLRFVYRDAGGREERRDVEPYRLVFRAGRWYLVGWDPSRSDWRTFRVDRMELRPPHGPRFRPRPAPDDAAKAVDVGIETSV